jgi:DNA modification methylase
MDPFMGSGTAAIEAQTLGINFIGLDVSPLCKIITDAKASSIYCIDEIERVQDILSKYYCNFKFINRDYYYNLLNELTDEYAVKCFFTLVRLNAFKYVLDTLKYSMAYSYYTDNMISYLKYFDYVRNYLNLKLGMAVSYTIDSRQGMEFIEKDSIDGIITSPPYFNALNYLDNEKLALLDLNFDDKSIRNNFIGLRQNTSNVYGEYENDLFKVYSGMYRCIKKNKYAVIIIGNNYFNGKSVRNTESNINAMNKSGFRLVENIPTDPYLNNKSVFRENILIFQK